MVRDGVVNIVVRLRECGFDPLRVGEDAWESRCPGHRSVDHSLSITRNEFNHAVLECRASQNCHQTKIIRALGFTNDEFCAETPDWLIASSKRVPVQPSRFTGLGAQEKEAEAGPTAADGVNGSARPGSPSKEQGTADGIEPYPTASPGVNSLAQKAAAIEDVSRRMRTHWLPRCHRQEKMRTWCSSDRIAPATRAVRRPQAVRTVETPAELSLVILRAGPFETTREGEPPCEPSADAGSGGPSPSRGPFETSWEGEPPCEPSADAGSGRTLALPRPL